MIKVIYENTTFAPGVKKIKYFNIEPEKEVVEHWIFQIIHKYHGNHEQGHGEYVYEVFQVNREPDHLINEDILLYEESIRQDQNKISTLKEKLKSPYKETNKIIL